jgi:ribonuclease P protein subunit POP4
MTSKSTQPITQALLARAHSPDAAERIFTEKIQYRPILLRPSSPPPTNARDARRKVRQLAKQKKKQKPKPLSARERRQLGLYDVPPGHAKYAVFEPVHKLWLGYIREILGGDVYRGGPDTAQKLTSADFHGAEVEVSRSGCVSRVGVKGIVIKDSRFVFEVITRKNRIKTIPKEGTVFKVVIPVESPKAEGAAEAKEGQDTEPEPAGEFVFEVYGDQFLYRAADRANKKFKSHLSKAL